VFKETGNKKIKETPSETPFWSLPK